MNPISLFRSLASDWREHEHLRIAAIGAVALGFGAWGVAISHGSYHYPDLINMLKGAGFSKDANKPFLIGNVLLYVAMGWAGIEKAFTGLQRDWRLQLARNQRQHTIVCGLGDVGFQIVQNLNRLKKPVVAVERKSDSAHAQTCDHMKVPVLRGDAKSAEVVKHAGLPHARNVVVTAGSDHESMDVALRMEKHVAQLAPDRQEPLLVVAEMRSDFMLNKLVHLNPAPLGAERMQLRLFNTYSDSARLLMKRLQPPLPLEFEATTTALFGSGPMASEALLHLVRASPVRLGRTNRILVFDEHAEEMQTCFASRYPAAASLAEIEFVTAAVHPDSPDLKNNIARRLEAAGPLLAAVVCMEDDESSLYGGQALRPLLDRAGDYRAPVYVHLPKNLRLGEYLAEAQSVRARFERLGAFGSLQEVLDPAILFDASLDRLAEALHEDFRARHEIKNRAVDVPWPRLAEMYKASNRFRADHTPLLMQFAGLHVTQGVRSPRVLQLTSGEAEMLAELEHRRYRIERLLMEWQPGERHGTVGKIGPNLRAWPELKQDVRQWNYDEARALPKMLADAGIELRRQQRLDLHGSEPGRAEQALDNALAATGDDHVVVIADLDDDRSVELAVRALPLPSASFWLFSREEPAELTRSSGNENSTPRQQLMAHCDGWALRTQLQRAERGSAAGEDAG